MNLFRSSRHTLSAAVAVLAVTAGCSTPAGPEAPAASTETSPPTTAPSTEPTGPEIPRTGDHEVSISIPELPIGGNSIPDGAEGQCATASWLQPEVFPDGGVKVTRIWIEPPDGFRVGGGCDGVRGCTSFTFRPGGGQCSVAVTGRGTPEAQLKVKGEFTCALGRESSCRELPARVNAGLVPLIQPEGTTAPESTTTEPPPSSAG
jgi:hypothetical protein